jgi:hypothetical protein
MTALGGHDDAEIPFNDQSDALDDMYPVRESCWARARASPLVLKRAYYALGITILLLIAALVTVIYLWATREITVVLPPSLDPPSLEPAPSPPA